MQCSSVARQNKSMKQIGETWIHYRFFINLQTKPNLHNYWTSNQCIEILFNMMTVSQKEYDCRHRDERPL